MAIEIKSGATLAGDWFRGLHRFAALVDGVKPVLVYGGDETFEREGVSVVGLAVVARLAARQSGCSGWKR